MKPKIYRIVMIPTSQIGDSRSLPAEVGSASPMIPVVPSRPLEHPQPMGSAAQLDLPPLEPVNGSILALEHPHESPVDRVVD